MANIKTFKPKKDIKVYILCGAVSTILIAEALMIVVGGLLAMLTNIPMNAINAALLTDAIGQGGLELLSVYTLFLGPAIVFFVVMCVTVPWRPYLKALVPATAGHRSKAHARVSCKARKPRKQSYIKSPGSGLAGSGPAGSGLAGSGPAGNKGSMLLIGLLIGFLMSGTCVLAAELSGSVQIEFKQFSIIGCIVFLIAIFIQSSTEEIFCRCFVYQRVKRTYNATVGIVVSSLFFSAGHLMNPGITPVALLMLFFTGVLYCMFVRYFDSIWLPMGVHTAWNFTQNVIFGLPNSGKASTYSFFSIAGDVTNGIAYDAAFGVEGSIVAVVITAACIVAIYVWGRKHNLKEFNIWKTTAEVAEVPNAARSAEAPEALDNVWPAEAPTTYKGWFY